MASYWDENSKNTLYLKISKGQTWPEFDAMIREMFALVENNHQNINLIISTDDCSPHNGALQHLEIAIGQLAKAKNIALILVVQKRKICFFSMLIKSILQFQVPEFSQLWHFVPSLEAARRLILQTTSSEKSN